MITRWVVALVIFAYVKPSWFWYVALAIGMICDVVIATSLVGLVGQAKGGMQALYRRVVAAKCPFGQQQREEGEP